MKKRLLLIMFLSLLHLLKVMAQDKMITGKITSQDDGLPLSGVTVALQGGSKSTVSNSEGNYKISVPAKGGVLSISFIGMVAKEVPVGSEPVLNVGLSQDLKQLATVVVSAIGFKQNRD